FAGKKSAQIREILINESAWEEMTCLFALSLRPAGGSFWSLLSPEFAINGDKLLRYNISYLGGKSDRQALLPLE
ncbi:hypothetical protein V9Y59_19840, partial [Klebsiella pneumoniae]